MEYKIIRKKIKNMYARLDENENLVITAPILMSIINIDKFANEAYPKLLKKRKKNNKVNSIYNEEGKLKLLGKYESDIHYSELNAMLLKTLKEYLDKNYINIAKMMGIENIPSVKIKKVKNYLGQYNKKTNNINLNLLLAHMSEELIEYVIIHELAHTRYMNHQGEFWKEVSKYCPYYKSYRTQCKKEFVYYENY